MPDPLPARILLVDDDPAFIKAMCDTLRREGYDLTAAQGGEAGLDVFHAALNSGQPFSVVITDLGMSPMDGRTVTLAVKQAAPATPVIMLTGWGQWFENPDGVTLPVDGVLGKPPKLSELRELLARFLPKG